MLLEQKLYKFECIGEDKRNSLILLVSPFPQGGTAQCQERLSHRDFFCREKWGHVSGYCLSQQCRCCQRGPFLSCPIESTESWTEWVGGRKRLGEQQIGLRGHYRDTDPTNHITDSIKKPTNKLLEIFSLWIPPSWPTGTPGAPCASATHCSWISVHAPEGRWLVSMCRKPAKISGPGRDHKLEL